MTSAEPITASVSINCYHCGEIIPPGVELSTEIGGESRAMCCPGCQAVASLIAGSGLESFYQQRTAYSERPDTRVESISQHFRVYDDPEVAASFCELGPDGHYQGRLLIGGVTCAACTWLIEQSLARLTGVSSAIVNLQHSRLDITFDPDTLPLSEIFTRVEELGYKPLPYQASHQRQQMAAEYRLDLRRLGVAGLGMMQVGMFAIALHAGDLQGIDPRYQGLLRWVSLVVASFVVYYSARPFFEAAWRHLRQRTLVMDLPVALAIGLAWAASLWATVSDTGQVYFDSVVMFTFFLLLGRFLERRVRQRHALTWFDAESLLPTTASKWENEQWQDVPRVRLQAGDRILIRAGDTVPVDAQILAGTSAVKEDTFNGEHLPRAVQANDTIFAGTVNIEKLLEATVLGDYRDSRLAALQQSVEVAQTEKPHLARLADRIASWFIAGILLITTATAITWMQIDPGRAFWITLSVLVISCPCALALATPAALTSAASALRRRGIIVRGENALEALSRTTHVVFDKTGTLTEGALAVSEVHPLGEQEPAELWRIASALQQYSSHPISQAFSHQVPASDFQDIQYLVGSGLQGTRNRITYRMGSEGFCRELNRELPPPPDQQHYWVALVQEDRPLAWFSLGDRVRAEAREVVAAFRQGGLQVELLTGDSSGHGPLLASELGIESVLRGMQPQQKMARVKDMQDQGAIVCMVGDGLNDAPVLSLADASFAVSGATDLARTQADFVILEQDLRGILTSWRQSLRCRRIIMQNFAWALTYNICAIPLAAMGMVPPWIAAIGMSLSSLLVVLNSLRLNGRP